MFLIMLVVWVFLCFLMATLAIFLQNYLNETPPDLKEVAWRAPAAGTLVTVFISVWCWLCAGNPERWAALFDFTTTQETDYFPKLKLVSNGQSWEVFFTKNAQNKVNYLPRPELPLPERR